MPTHRYVEQIGLAAMLAIRRLATVTPEVNLSGHITCMPLPEQGCRSGFETQRRHHQKSKAQQKGLMSSQFFFKKIKKKQQENYVKECKI